MKHKVSELSGALLDAAVAKAEGWDIQLSDPFDGRYGATMGATWCNGGDFSFSSDWAQGGPIIERERICLIRFPLGWVARIMEPYEDVFDTSQGWERYFSPTALIAAMRAYVASKFGDEIDL